MADLISALSGHYQPRHLSTINNHAAIKLEEKPISTLFQIAGWPDSFEQAAKALANSIGLPQPKDFKFSSNIGTSSVFAIAPETWLCSSENPTLLDKANDEVPGQTLYLADLSHAWTRIILSDEESSTLLMRGFPVDLSNAEFPEFRFAKSVIHGMPLLIHRLGKTSAKGSHDTGAIFDLYVQRSFAVSFWEWLIMHASSFSYKVV